ncbi:MAG TPA: HEAT repeat domain-containing protein [Phycisphaerales bacterium]|nr:HEAT repeat domain-containing protein [Phycisphaerales bacterium]
MDGMRFRTTVLVAMLAVCGIVLSQEAPLATPTAGTAEQGTAVDDQLEIIKNALLKGTSDDIRIKAATVLLADTAPPARAMLLETLADTKNDAARTAVCRALMQGRTAQRTLVNKADFIAPLMRMVSGANAELARLSADATLVFKYNEIAPSIEALLADPNAPSNARLNAVYVLKLHPDVGAAIKLIQLIDDADSKVAAAAMNAAVLAGLATGKDPAARLQIVDQLRQEGPEVFLQKRLIQQQAEARKLEVELAAWRERYLAELNKRYEAIGDDAAKGKFLADLLAGDETTVKLWALEKVRQGRVGTTTNPKMAAELGDVLVKLVSDTHRDVRLRTARLLSLMGELHSAEQLLAQLGVETDDEVRTEQFVALGGAVYHASLPNPGVKVAPEVRKKTLTLAMEFLGRSDARKAREGADVVRKLLEQNGLTAQELTTYLSAVSNRYQQESDPNNGSLRSELMAVMGALCGPRCICRDEAAKIYKPLFDNALQDSSEAVRLEAVNGLIQIDKAAALAQLREKYASDKNPAIRAALRNLAGEVGGEQDLAWLSGSPGANGESELAWQAMLKIFGRSSTAVVETWATRLSGSPEAGAFVLSGEQRIQLLTILEQKAMTDKKTALATSTALQLALLYRKSGDFEQAAAFLRKALDSIEKPQDRAVVVADLVDCYLRQSKFDLAAKQLQIYLAAQDLSVTGPVAVQIAAFLATPPAGVDPKMVLKVFQDLPVGADLSRPNWQRQLRQWEAMINTVADPNQPRAAGG